MKLSLLILLLVSFNSYAADDMVQFQPQPNNTINESLLEQQQKNTVDLAVIKLKLETQRKEIEGVSQTLRQQGQNVTDLKVQLVDTDAKLKIQDLRKELLDRQESSIDRWWAVIGTFLGIFGLLIPLGAWLYGRSYFRSLKSEIEKLKELNKDGIEELGKIKEHGKSAESLASQISDKWELVSGEKPDQETVERIKTSPDATKLDKQIAYAYELRDKGDFYDAINQWQQILGVATYSDDKKLQARSYFNLGYLLDETNNYEQAISAYKEAIALNPEYSEAYNNMGRSYAGLEDYEPAISAFKKAVALSPEDSEAKKNLELALSLNNKVSDD